MDNNEATSTLMLRIQNLDPENACKIMGYILIQDPGEKEIIRLALGPETILINIINQAKSHLGISSNASFIPSSPPVFNSPRRNLLTQTSPRIILPNSPSSPWSSVSPKPSASSPSYAAAVVNGTANFEPFSCNDQTKEFTNGQEQLVFDTKNINFMDSVTSPSARSDSIVFPFDNYSETHQHNNLHRRSFSVSDVYQSDDDNNSWKPCMYFSRGFCKNGSNCKFVHDSSPDPTFVGSPKMDGFGLDELLRYKALQHQRFAAASQLMAGGGGAPFPYNRCMNFLNENQRSAAAALMMGEEYLKFSRCRPERNDFGFGGVPNSSARQIYLTFPADSTFKEDDVSRYFGTYGPVQDVRIPYQQKRMFGFVTFVYPETVKRILAHGNPHFVCDSRVLVKPYKEKGKLADKKQHMERGEFPECLSPSGLDLTEPCDLPFFYNSHEMMLKRKLQEQTDLEQAIELHGRRLMNFQLLDLPNHQLRPHLVAAVPTHSPTQSHAHVNQNIVFSSDEINQDFLEGSNGGNDEADSPAAETDPKILEEVNESSIINNGDFIGTDKVGEGLNLENYGHHESVERILPDNLFASPTKSASEPKSLFCTASAESDGIIPVSFNDFPALPTTSTLGMASPKACYIGSIPVTTTPVSFNNVPTTLGMASPKPCYVDMPSH